MAYRPGIVPASPTPPPERVDVVVIGAGMGGLTAAAVLAKAGLCVCVLEMDARPGGYLAGFRRKEFIFDSAIHWLNLCGPGGTVRRILDFVGPGAPETPQLRRIRRYRGDSFDYLLTNQPDELRDELMADHPEQAAGVRDFFAAARMLGDAYADLARRMRSPETMSLVERTRAGMGMAKIGIAFGRYAGSSTEAGLDKRFKTPVLKKIFCSEERLVSCLTPVGWAYHGDYQQPPKGGSRMLPRFLAESCERFGGRVVYRARVDKVLVSARKVAGVEALVGTRQQRHTIACDYVLASSDLETLYEKMLPKGAIDESLLGKIREADIYESAVTISIGLDVPAEQLGFGEELVMLTRDDVSRAEHNCTDPAKSAISILAPSARDKTLAPAGKGTLTCLTTANIAYGERWKTGPNDARGPEYAEFKQGYADVLIDRVAAALSPELRAHIDLVDVATPITHRRYTGNRDGSIMGGRPTRANMRNKIAHYKTPVENLLLSGHWAEYGGGVPAAVRAGSNAAMLVLQSARPAAFEIFRDILDFKREPEDVDPALFQPLVALAPKKATGACPGSGRRWSPSCAGAAGSRPGRSNR